MSPPNFWCRWQPIQPGLPFHLAVTASGVLTESAFYINGQVVQSNPPNEVQALQQGSPQSMTNALGSVYGPDLDFRAYNRDLGRRRGIRHLRLWCFQSAFRLAAI